MRRRVLAPSFVVTVVGLTHACTHAPGIASPPPASSDTDAYQPLNFVDSKHGTIFVSGSECFVETEPGKYPGTYETEKVACPAAMHGPSWDACQGGIIKRLKATPDACECARSGNPPPSNTKVPCP